MTSSENTPIEILLVEDNPGDVKLTREALKLGRIANNLNVVEDGTKVLPFLTKQGEYAAAPRIDLILLDLNLPKKDGREVLAELKRHPEYKLIPVVVLTSSNAERDILQAYDLGANCFIAKPVDLEQFMYAIQHLEIFWFSIVRLPTSRSKS
jgi:two-component system, chemotaxis family, response regulator Rcp1